MSEEILPERFLDVNEELCRLCDAAEARGERIRSVLLSEVLLSCIVEFMQVEGQPLSWFHPDMGGYPYYLHSGWWYPVRCVQTAGSSVVLGVMTDGDPIPEREQPALSSAAGL